MELATRTFRAGEAYELVVFDRLGTEERALVAELQADPGFYGLLRPRNGSGRTLRAVDRATALLFLTLQAPGQLPFFVWQDGAEPARRSITQLVLDGVLELEDAGRFVSGSSALDLLAPRLEATHNGRISALAHAALRYAQQLQLEDPLALSGALYNFGREPVTAAWDRRTPDREHALQVLGAGPGSSLRKRLETRWHWPESPESPAWIPWGQRNPRRVARGPIHKLYVSPAANDLPATFGIVVDVLDRLGGPDFKVGANAAGWLRPDKLVVYFSDLEALLQAATDLTTALAGVPPHGVPFTAEIAGDGLLSWGIDPPLEAHALPWEAQLSWRLWIVRRLASALIAAQASPADKVEPWQFALERLRCEGLDVDEWTPSATLWSKG